MGHLTAPRRALRLVTLSATSVLAWGLCSPRNAAACSPPFCTATRVGAVAQGTVTAGLPAIAVYPGSSHRIADAGTDEERMAQVALFDNGVVVPTTLRAPTDDTLQGWLLVPQAPLVAGHAYSVRYPEPCPAAQDAGPEGEVSFTTSASLAVPAAFGTVTIAEERGTAGYGASSSCFEPITARSGIALTVRLASELGPFRGTLGLRTSVDGAEWSTVNFGGEIERDDASIQGPARFKRDPRYVYAACNGATEGLSVGPHVVRVQVLVPGAVVQPAAVEITHSFSCVGAVVGTDILVPGGPVEDGSTAGDEAKGASGCAAAGAAAGSLASLSPVAQAFALLSAAVLGLSGLRRLRRRT